MHINQLPQHYYLIELRRRVNLTNADMLVNMSKQGWQPCENDECRTMEVVLCKRIEVAYNKHEIHQYIDAINSLGGAIRVAWYEQMRMYYVCDSQFPNKVVVFEDYDEGIQIPAVYTDLARANSVCENMNSNDAYRRYIVRQVQ